MLAGRVGVVCLRAEGWSGVGWGGQGGYLAPLAVGVKS